MNYPEDEVSLYDLWSVIAKRKLLFCLVFIIVLIVGISTSLLRPKHYQYAQAIKIASYYDDGNTITLQSSKTVVSKITALYLPVVLNQYNTQHVDTPVYLNDDNFSVNDLGDGVVVLSVTGLMRNQAAYAEIFKSLLARLVTEETPLVQAIKDSLTDQLKHLNKELEFQVNFNKTLAEKVVNLEDVALQHIILTQKKETYTDLTASIADVERNLDTLSNSHFISDITRSANSVGIARSALVMLFIMAGLILGLLMVFIVEFFANAKKRL